MIVRKNAVQGKLEGIIISVSVKYKIRIGIQNMISACAQVMLKYKLALTKEVSPTTFLVNT